MATRRSPAAHTPFCLTEQGGNKEGFRQDFISTLEAASAGGHDVRCWGAVQICSASVGNVRQPVRPRLTHTQPPVALVAGVNFPMLLQTDEVRMARYDRLPGQLIELPPPTLVQAKPADTAQTDDFKEPHMSISFVPH